VQDSISSWLLLPNRDAQYLLPLQFVATSNPLATKYLARPAPMSPMDRIPILDGWSGAVIVGKQHSLVQPGCLSKSTCPRIKPRLGYMRPAYTKRQVYRGSRVRLLNHFSTLAQPNHRDGVLKKAAATNPGITWSRESGKGQMHSRSTRVPQNTVVYEYVPTYLPTYEPR
jgi:hypothetical protein